MSEKHESDRRFPIQGGLTISWAAADEAYRGYSRLYGTSQSLVRLAERGGFGLCEFVCLVYAGRADSIGTARDITHGRPSDAHYVAVLAAADVRSGTEATHQEALRQLAAVTAERDALRQQLATAEACRELNQEQRDEWRASADQATAERDALKRRLAELEHGAVSNRTCSVCGRTERPSGACETGGALCPWTVANQPPRAAQGG